MKLLGALLILTGTFGGYLAYRRSALHLMALSKALADDLAVLRCRICIYRRTLPSILAEDLGQGSGNALFWSPLRELLERSGDSVRVCWENASRALPAPLDKILGPLGHFVPAGGETLASSIDEVRSELLSFIQAQQEQQPVKLRIAAAMCFSCAALFILICI